jgi:hypothetical protein
MSHRGDELTACQDEKSGGWLYRTKRFSSALWATCMAIWVRGHESVTLIACEIDIVAEQPLHERP